MAANNGPVLSDGVYNNGSLPGPVVQLERQDGPMAALLLDEFTPKFRTGYVKVGADEFVMPEHYRKFAKRLETFETKLDDVFVASHPKAGATWTQEMVWCIANDLDFVGAEQILPKRFPFLERIQRLLFNYTDMMQRSPELVLPDYVTDSMCFVEKLESPRSIKTHLPWDLLPGEIRDAGKQPKDLGSVIRKTADFLGKTLSEEQVTRLEQHLKLSRRCPKTRILN